MTKEKEVRKITLGWVVSWVLGIIFLLSGIGSLISSSFAIGFVLLGMATVLLPPFTTAMRNVYKFEFSKGMKIAIVLLGLIVIAFIPNNEISIQPATTQEKPKEISTPQQTSVQKESITPKLYTGDVSSLLPTRAEIDTEFKIEGEREYNTSRYFREDNIPSTGFREGRIMDLEIFEGNSITIGYILIFVFDTNENTKKYYDNIISITKNEGGYKEQSVSGINANCFAIHIGNAFEGYARDIYCYKNNVFFSTELSSFRTTRLAKYRDWVKVVANKI